MSMQGPEEPRSSALVEVLPGLEAALVGSAILPAVSLGSADESFQGGAEILPYDSSTISEISRLRRAKHVIQNLGRAAWTDVKENDNKIRAISSGIMASGVQVIGFTKAPSILIPQATMSVLHSTGSPVEAGATAALLFGTWCLTVGETINSSKGHYPATLRAIGDSWPNVVRHCSDALPGLETSNESAQETRRLSARRIGSLALTHTKRGSMAFGAGIIPYLATAGVNKEPKSAIRKLSTMLSLDGAAVVGTLFFGVGEAIINLGHSHPELAQHIQNDAKSVKLWYGVAGVLVVAVWLKNRRKGEPTPG